MAMAYAQQTKPRNDPLPPAVTFARLPFRGFAPEKELRTHAPRCDVDLNLQKICRAWEVFCARVEELEFYSHTQLTIYFTALNSVFGVNCSAHELNAFMLLLPELIEGEIMRWVDAGFFISALVNSGSEDFYTIETRHLGVPLMLGYMNTGNVVINGEITAAGDEMKSGTILINGNVLSGVGKAMKGGKITVMGNVKEVGEEMSGGEVHVHGNCEKICDSINGGQIFIQGAQVYPHQTSEQVHELVPEPVPEAEARLE